MSALIFAEKVPNEDILRDQLSKQFDDFDLVLLYPTEHTLYFEANQALRLVKTHEGPVFLIVNTNGELFAAIISAKISRLVHSFQIMTWVGNRFRVLRAP